jgi:hypothetical protein
VVVPGQVRVAKIGLSEVKMLSTSNDLSFALELLPAKLNPGSQQLVERGFQSVLAHQ